jgi:hypothetical protein
MLKVITALPRRSDHTRASFQQHWGTVHRDYALQIDRIARYVQAHPADVNLTGVPPLAYDGFPEVWFNDLDEALSLGTDPQYTQGAHRDEPRFIDVDRMTRTWATPNLVKPWPGFDEREGAGKLLILLVGPADAQATEALTDVGQALGAQRIMVSVAVDDERVAERQGFGLALELWFESPEAALAAWEAGHEQAVAALREVADVEASTFALINESRVRYPGTVTE